MTSIDCFQELEFTDDLSLVRNYFHVGEKIFVSRLNIHKKFSPRLVTDWRARYIAYEDASKSELHPGHVKNRSRPSNNLWTTLLE